MFTMQPLPTFISEVAIPPVQNKRVLKVEFKHKDEDQLNEFFKALPNFESDAEALAEIVENWHDADVQYSPSNLALLIKKYPGAATAMFEKYRVDLTGAERKN